MTSSSSRVVRVLELRSVWGTGGGPEKTIILGAARTDRSRYAVTVCYVRDERDEVFGVAKRLAEGGADADRLRAAVNQSISGEPPKKGGILKALLASPLIGSELDLPRPREEGRKVDL